jgi:sec-independent protein translocase protein TatA
MLTAELLGPDLIIVIVVAVVVLLFGGSKLPKLARGLGSASHEFKKGLEEGAAEGMNPSATQSAPAVPPASPSVPPSASDAVPKDAGNS